MCDQAHQSKLQLKLVTSTICCMLNRRICFSVAEKLDDSSKDLWHRRYSHLGVKNLQKLAKR